MSLRNEDVDPERRHDHVKGAHCDLAAGSARARSLVEDDVAKTGWQLDRVALRPWRDLNRPRHAERRVVDGHGRRLAALHRGDAVRALRFRGGTQRGRADRGARKAQLKLRDIRLRAAGVPARDHARVENVQCEQAAGGIGRRYRAVRRLAGRRRVAKDRGLVVDLGRSAEALRGR